MLKQIMTDLDASLDKLNYAARGKLHSSSGYIDTASSYIIIHAEDVLRCLIRRSGAQSKAWADAWGLAT